MRTVDIETLRKRLGEYVRLAAAGETILVTKGGQVLAELRPHGLVPPRLPVAPLEDILAGLARDREDR